MCLCGVRVVYVCMYVDVCDIVIPDTLLCSTVPATDKDPIPAALPVISYCALMTEGSTLDPGSLPTVPKLRTVCLWSTAIVEDEVIDPMCMLLHM